MFKKRDPKIEREILDIKKRLNAFELEIEKIKSHIISLRGFVNRKLSGDLPTETLKSVDGLDELRK